MPDSPVLLLVDDDHKLRALISEYLEGYGFIVHSLEHGNRFLAYVEHLKPDLVLLDIMLPGRDGLELLRDLRAHWRIPAIMLTAKGEDMDRIVGLELGADDYLGKPFNPRELLARIKAVLRRSNGADASDEAQAQLVSSKRGMELDIQRQVLLAPEQDQDLPPREVELSLSECRILAALMQRPNRAVDRDTLMTQARGREFTAFDRSIDVHVSRLRAKLADLACCEDAIKTVWGTGYMFVDR